MSAPARRIAIIGGGWSGMSAAVEGVVAGHEVTVFEAARMLGGRARALTCTLPDGSTAILDNGQHILIGAYTQTLRMMQLVGIDTAQALLRLPLRLQFPDGGGLRLPDWPAPLDALVGIGMARGWRVSDKLALLQLATRWRRHKFHCPASTSVAELCEGATPRVLTDMIEPLCVSALNIAPAQASGQVFLRVIHDSMFGGRGASRLLLPRLDLTSLFPQAAARWISARGAGIHLGRRVQIHVDDHAGWRVDDAHFDQVLVATAAPDAARLVDAASAGMPMDARREAAAWCGTVRGLQHTAITTVYAWAKGATLAQPLLALRSRGTGQSVSPAQFVFDRGQLGGPRGLLAFVISASGTDRTTAEQLVLQQARKQLNLDLAPVQTVVEKRATFACVPDLRRPGMQIAPGIRACGDYVDGPYPATLEAAVRAGISAIRC